MADTRLRQALKEGRVRLKRREQVTVGTSRTDLAGGDPDRAILRVVNQDATARVHTDDSEDVDTSSGDRVPPGGTIEYAADIDGERVTADFYGVSTEASTTVTVFEYEVIPDA